MWSMSLKWMVKRAIRHPDQRKPSYRDWESRTQRARYDCSKARKLLNWNPTTLQTEIVRRGIQVPAWSDLPETTPADFACYPQHNRICR